MSPLPHPSVTPLPSFASLERPPGLPSPLPLSSQFLNVLAWLAGRRPSRDERAREEQLAARLGRMIEAEEGEP
jgi:hypothetical protein